MVSYDIKPHFFNPRTPRTRTFFSITLTLFNQTNTQECLTAHTAPCGQTKTVIALDCHTGVCVRPLAQDDWSVHVWAWVVRPCCAQCSLPLVHRGRVQTSCQSGSFWWILTQKFTITKLQCGHVSTTSAIHILLHMPFQIGVAESGKEWRFVSELWTKGSGFFQDPASPDKPSLPSTMDNDNEARDILTNFTQPQIQDDTWAQMENVSSYFRD